MSYTPTWLEEVGESREMECIYLAIAVRPTLGHHKDLADHSQPT